MNRLERWYRWAADERLHYGVWGARFMLPAIPPLILGFALLALDIRAGGAIALVAAAFWAAIFVALQLRDLARALAGVVRKMMR